MKLAIRLKETDRSASRLGDEDGEDGQDDDVWRAPATAREALLRRARTVAAINANPRRRDDMSARAAHCGQPVSFVTRGDEPRQAQGAGRASLADAIREQTFAALAGREQVRGVVVQFVTCSLRGPRVRVRAWLDAGAIVTVERDDEDESTTPMLLAAAIVVAVEREMPLRGSTNRLQERREP